MVEYNVRSKICYRPRKSRLVYKIFLNFCLLTILICGIITIIGDGFSVGTLGYMAIAFFIVSRFNQRSKYNEHYEFAIAHLVMDGNDITISYQPTDTMLERIFCIDANSIKRLEYSDKLCCLRIVADVIEKNDEKETKQEEFYLYLEKGFEKDIINDFEKCSNIKVHYMDR